MIEMSIPFLVDMRPAIQRHCCSVNAKGTQSLNHRTQKSADNREYGHQRAQIIRADIRDEVGNGVLQAGCVDRSKRFREKFVSGSFE